MTGEAANNWRGLSAAEVGESHLVLTPPLPCQDACAASAAGRPLLIVADGLGSRPLSHIGADAVVRLTPCHFAGIEDFLVRFLDCPLPAAAAGQWCQEIARGIVRFAGAVLDDLGRRMGHDARAFQCTLLLAVTGRQSTFWLQVGDGDLVFEGQDGDLTTACPPGRQEHADVTCTIRNALALPALACGLIETARLSGIAAFSDGTGERLVSQSGQGIAQLVRRFLKALREQELSRLDVLDFLRDRDVWRKTSRDDRSLALLVKTP